MSSSKPALPHNRTIRCKAAKEALPTDAHSTVTTCYSNPVSRIARDLQQRRNGMHRKTKHQLLECWRTCQDRVFCGDTPCVCKMVQTHDAFRPASLCCSGIVNLLPGLQRAPHQRGYVVARPSQSAALLLQMLQLPLLLLHFLLGLWLAVLAQMLLTRSSLRVLSLMIWPLDWLAASVLAPGAPTAQNSAPLGMCWL